MQQNPLGETGLTVSAVSFGTADVQKLSWTSGLAENN
jgi:aryl-alcohol dehydrogenase-like predicted oxidoreductase